MDYSLKDARLFEEKGEHELALKAYKYLSEKISPTAFKLNIENLESLLKDTGSSLNQAYLYLDTSYREYIGPSHPFLRKCKDGPTDFMNYQGFPRDRWPSDLRLPIVEGLNNDYTPIERIKSSLLAAKKEYTRLSIVIPYFERPMFLPHILNSILTQTGDLDIEVIISDDGSCKIPAEIIQTFEKILDFKYIRRPNSGYTLNHARNAGVRLATSDIILILDSDIVLPGHFCEELSMWFSSYAKLFVMGYRKFIDLEENYVLLTELKQGWEKEIRQTKSENSHMPILQNNNYSVDWRLEKLEESNWLKDEEHPFKLAAGCMMAFRKTDWEAVGGFDEEFTKWGCEDLEFCYRLYKNGSYFVADQNIYGYHLEPIEGENENVRDQRDMQNLLYKKVPIYWRNASWKPWCDIKEAYASSKKTPVCSVQMPVYNGASYIASAIKSVQEQSFSDWELVICDDGSTDGTSEIIKQFALHDERIKIIRQSNQGIKAARIITQKNSLGQYWCMLDSDDVLHKECLERTLAAMERKKKDGVGVVYTNNCAVIENDEFGDLRWNVSEFSREHLLLNMIVHHFRMIDSRYWNRSIKFCEHLRTAEDLEMMLVLSNYCKFYHLDEALYGYRQHGNMSSKINMRKLNVQDGHRYRFLELNSCSEWKVVRPHSKDPRIITFVCDVAVETNGQHMLD